MFPQDEFILSAQPDLEDSLAKPDGRRGILLHVAYEGTSFRGYAMQNDARTVAGSLHEAICKLDPFVTEIRGTSRTDAGVHAKTQYVAFDPSKHISLEGWVLGINRHLPLDMVVKEAREISVGYNPRFEAKKKTYAYRLLLDPVRDPLRRFDTWYVRHELDLELLREEALSAVGEHDFGAFRRQREIQGTTVRSIDRISFSFEGEPASKAYPRVFVIHVQGRAFMYNMIRILVGTFVDVARGRKPKGSVHFAIQSKNRKDAGVTAPPQGLCLENIELHPAMFWGDSWPSETS